MISLREARAIIARNVPVLPSESCPLENAPGCVLRKEVRALEDFPAFDRSAMDGYAIIGDETGDTFRIVGESTPGAIPKRALESGECIRIFTGAALPPKARRVVPQEWVERHGDLMVLKIREGGDFIRRRGEDARSGDILLSAGQRLEAGELSLLAQIGESLPLVSKRPRVAHVATGNELVAPDQIPAPGQIRDSNSTLISALLRKAGADLVLQDRCGDDPHTLPEFLKSGLDAGSDLLLISGGASVGDYDFGPRVLENLGFTIQFRQIDLKPGKPLVFATRGEKVAFVIPGNPVSHFVTFQLAIRSALDRLQGVEADLPEADVQLLSGIPAQRDTRENYWPARVGVRGGRLCAEPLKWQSSGDLRGLVGANGLLHISPGRTPIEEGADAPCVLIDFL